MFPTNGVILTNAGIDLISRSLSESVPVVFTTAKIGTGDIDNMDQARNLKDLKNTYKVIGITSISRNNSGLVKIRSSYTNKDFLESVQIKEIGIFAKVSGVSEVLMGYVNDGIGELVPPGNTGNIVERIRDLYIGITEDAEVTAIIDGSIIYATIYDLEEGLKKKSDIGHIHQNATGTVSGFMSSGDKGKLDGIEQGANKYIHQDNANIRHVTDAEKAVWNGKEPAIAKKTGFNLDKTDVTEDNTAKLFTAKGAFNLFNSLTTSINNVIASLNNHIAKKASPTEDGHMIAGDKAKLNGIAPGANNYVHPDTATTRHVSDTEKAVWNGKEPAIAKKSGFNLDKTDDKEDNTNKLFTAKGALNLFNSLTSSINTVINNLNNHIAKKVSPTEDGHMIASDKAKLNGIAPGANNYVHPDTATTRHVSDTEKAAWNGKEPAIAKKTAFNKDFGTRLDSVLEGAKMAELLGVEYGGILNNTNSKVVGLAYYCTSNKSLFRCKVANNLNYANLDYYIAFSHSDFASKLENLIIITTIGSATIFKYSNGSMVIFGVTQSTDTNPKVHIFPEQFKAPPLVQYSATCYDLTKSTYIGYVDSITNNSFRFVVRDIEGGPKNEGVTYIATGKWK